MAIQSEKIVFYWDDIESSTISSVKFEADFNSKNKPSNIRGVLMVTFKKSMQIYSYDDVPMSKFIDFINSKSAGSYFADNIKNSYRYVKL